MLVIPILIKAVFLEETINYPCVSKHGNIASNPVDTHKLNNI